LTDRLPAALEVKAICRAVEAGGGFATVIRRGDEERGTLLLMVTERGSPRGLLERRMGDNFTYRWQWSEGSAADPARLTARLKADPDCWAIELDIADAERFIAEMTATG
jgi:hypothetical protein